MNDRIHLQGIGKVKAKIANEIQVGDVLMWNFGAESTVTEIVKRTNSQIVIKEDYNGKTYERRMSKTRLVGIGGGKNVRAGKTYR